MNIDHVASAAWRWAQTLELPYQIALGLAALLAVLGMIVFVVVLWQALSLAVMRGYAATVNAIPYMGETLADSICIAIRAAVKEMVVLLRIALWVVLYPVTAVCSLLWAAVATVMDGWEESRRRERELRDLWNAEYRHAYRSFHKFRKWFESVAEQDRDLPPFEDVAPEPPEPPPEQHFAEACHLLGLPSDGSFTKRQLDQSYRALMQRHHPDHAGGSAEMAAALNSARDLIRNLKGWR